MEHSIITIVRKLFRRDLTKLRKEIELYQNEEVLWSIEKSIANSAGNLCLHLLGNLNAYIGAVFGQTGYIRNRPLEFSDKHVPKSQLFEMIDQTIIDVDASLTKLTAEQLQEPYPLLVFKERTTTEYMLVHLTTHLTYHLGQVNYHRRLLDN